MKRKASRLRATGLVLLLGACLAGLIAFGVSPSQAAQPGSVAPALPNLDLGGPARGQAAIDAMGSDLSIVAKAYRTTATKLAERFHQDSSLVLDRKGRLYYTCTAAPADVAKQTSPAMLTALAPLDQTFLLHSLPGSNRVIYLDFGGGTLSGTAWNASTGYTKITCPRWDANGNGQTWDDYDLKAIQMVWQRVAEDYAPYDVDVTTQAPAVDSITRSSSTDDVYGTRVLVSPIQKYFGPYGGIAYVGIYNGVDTTNYYKPALVFPEGLGTEKCVGEAASHEAGHNLGLSHDGLTNGTAYYVGQGPELAAGGVTGWAPIMGASYYRNLTEWSKGDYASANNTEDDLQVISSYGLNFRADDYGDTLASATVLSGGAELTAAGIINTATDVDVFRFTAPTGSLTISANPATPGPDADIEARVFDAGGSLLFTSNGLNALGVQGTVALPADGDYFLQVDGVGEGDPLLQGYSDYASLGHYDLHLTLGPTVTDTPPVAVAYAWPLTGNAPLTVGFSSAESSDPDGTIVRYEWDFGDGSTSSYPNPSHLYKSGGVFTATLTVTDDDGATAASSVTVTVNAPPVPVATATPLSGVAPLAVRFSSAGSTDSDGSIAKYAWAFGDGSTSTAANPSHTYSKLGSYTATLTLTDNKGATATTTVAIQALAYTLHVGDITLVRTVSRFSSTITATVLVLDTVGKPAANATVSVRWTGVLTGTGSAKTNASGVATFSKSTTSKSGTVTIAVTGVSKSGATYQPGQNLETQVSLTF
jgi:PKD repeat protein